MKLRVITLLVTVALLASCSSRYGYMPKGKKQKHTVAKKEFRKKKIAPVEGITIKRPDNGSNYQQPEITVAEVEPIKIERTEKQNTVAPNTPKKDAASPIVVKKAERLKQILKPNRTQKVEKQSDTKEVARGSFLWYLIVGLVLILIGALLPGVVGYIFYVVGVIAIIFALLILLGIVV